MAQPLESSLFDVSAYKYNAAALSCSQQVQLFGRLAQQLASPAGPTLLPSWGAPFHPGAQAGWQHAQCYGAPHQWGAMPAWPQPGGAAQMPNWWTMPPAPAPAPAGPLALNPLSAEALASALHPAPPCKPGAAAKPCATRSSSLQNNCNGTGAAAAAAPVEAEDEDLCDDLFRIFADDDLPAPLAGAAAAVSPDVAGAKPSTAQDLDSLMGSQTATDQHNNLPLPASPAPPALCPPPLLPAYHPAPPPIPTPTSSATSLPFGPAAAAPPAAFYAHHLYPQAGAPFPTTTSTVFSAASAFPPASRSPTPPAAHAPSPVASSMARAGSASASPASSHHRGNGGSVVSGATTPKGGAASSRLHAVQAGAVRKPSGALAASGRQGSSPLSLAAATLLEAELLPLAAARAPSPLGAGAVQAYGDEAEGSCPLPGVALGQQQQAAEAAAVDPSALLLCGPAAVAAAAEPLDCCDNLSHTLDWMDVLT